jgi:GxxExxY protein
MREPLRTPTDIREGGLVDGKLSGRPKADIVLPAKVVTFARQVHRKLGRGFPKRVYQNALMVLLRREGIPAVQHAPIAVHFEGVPVGEYEADILVQKKLVVEIKVLAALTSTYRRRLRHSLKATGMRAGVLLNFGAGGLEYERVVLTAGRQE